MVTVELPPFQYRTTLSNLGGAGTCSKNRREYIQVSLRSRERFWDVVYVKNIRYTPVSHMTTPRSDAPLGSPLAPARRVVWWDNRRNGLDCTTNTTRSTSPGWPFSLPKTLFSHGFLRKAADFESQPATISCPGFLSDSAIPLCFREGEHEAKSGSPRHTVPGDTGAWTRAPMRPSARAVFGVAEAAHDRPGTFRNAGPALL